MFRKRLLQNPTKCWNIRASRATHCAVRPDVYSSDNVTGADNQQERLSCDESAKWFRVLELAQTVFASGSIAPKPGNRQVLVYRVASRKVLVERVIPFFERYVVPFTCKGAMFEGFRDIVFAMQRKDHLTPDGLVRVIERAYSMNPNSKGRARLRTLPELRERILRGHTSDIPLARG